MVKKNPIDSTEANDPSNQRILSIALYQIDVENKQYREVPISHINSDLEIYLSELLREIETKTTKREYEFNRETTELFTALSSFHKNNDLSTNTSSGNLASRLLEKEVDTDKRYGHLGASGNGHVKRGSFLQFIYKTGSIVSYLGVKIEHQMFIDENDFKRKIGLSIANKIYKACRVTYDNKKPIDISIYDTNQKPSTYWWKDFLELKEVRNDAYNTKTASDEVIRAHFKSAVSR